MTSRPVQSVGNNDMSPGSADLGRSIQLPSENSEFRHITDAKIFAMDIGGSLTKIAYYATMPFKKIIYQPVAKDKAQGHIEVRDEAVYEVSESARLHFIKFETVHFDHCLDYISQSFMNKKKQEIMMQDIKVTGGGAYKYARAIKEKLGLDIEKCDEMPCIVHGCNFLLKNISDEVFIYQWKGIPEYKFQTINPTNMFPYLLVTIGSGVSIIKVESDEKFQRIGGTATGGGTFWGLGRLLTKAETFDDLLELASQGDHRKVDMLVRDIYGDPASDNYADRLGLPADLIASSFGKTMRRDQASSQEENNDFTSADIARSLLYMISNDIGQVASLYALHHDIRTIYFGGFFLRHHPVSMHTVSYSVNFWSKGKVQPMFLRHEGYLGAIGAFLRGAKELCGTDDYSWKENMYGSSGFPTSKLRSFASQVDHLEIDRTDTKLRFCPFLLNPVSYNPDTVDLTRDDMAREYWLQCLIDSLPKFTDRAIKSQETSPTVHERAQKFKEQYISRLELLKSNPFAFGNLTVRSLLDLREHCLLEFDFYDPYLKQKQLENDQALKKLSQRLAYLAELSDRQRFNELALGMLAGNVFDWGAKEVALILENKGLDFNEALGLIGPHPWLMDDLDIWIERMEKGSPHKCATIFIDNSGVDVILGIIPFVCELVKRGTKVLLCANNRPILNDVTYSELTLILERASSISSDIKEALESKRLRCFDSGQSSPCLDLTKLNQILVDAMIEEEVDLIILEGMGRAVHTNLFAKFNCESLKVAVLKNRWLAKRLGGEMYAIIFRYERPNSEDDEKNT